MRYFIVPLFLICLLFFGFLALNMLWNWIDIHYSTVVKAVVSVAVCLFVLTGIAMAWSAGFARHKTHPVVGKKHE